MAQTRARPTVAPSLSSGSGAPWTSSHKVLDDVEEVEDYEEPAESSDDWV